MLRMNNAKKRMRAETRDEEQLNVREGDVINLPNLLFTENRDYLVKYNDDQKVCTIYMDCHCTCSVHEIYFIENTCSY